MKLFIFGSTGDLVKRKVLPALHHIPGLEVYALGRKEMDHKDYHEIYCPEGEDVFLKRLKYVQVDFSAILHHIQDHLDLEETNYFYISMPPEMIRGIIEHLSELKTHKIKILIEKPFGNSLEEAKFLAKLIKENNLEKDIFLADHYVFKKNIFDLKKENYKKVKMVSLEKVGLENRGYYDAVGALKDMVQSHFLNTFFRVYNKQINLKGVKVLEFNRGQYKTYRSDLGKDSLTETYVKLKLLMNETEVEFITGKGFDKKEGFIELDSNKFSFGEDNSYIKMFQSFIDGKYEDFPTIENSIKSWEIIENVEKQRKELFFYEKDSKVNEFI